ncbi:MlaD family protein [Aureispira]|nr:MlaD family protein [Aureispira sp.]
MKISKEAITGIAGVLIILILCYAFLFMKRHNAFSTNMIITAKCNDIEFLKKGNLVLIKGRDYGYVAAIYKVGDDLFVDMDIETNVKIPPTAKAVVSELSLLGGRTISIVYEGSCTDDCLTSGAVIPGEVYTLKEQVENFAGPGLKKFGVLSDSLMGPNGMQSMLDNAYSSISGLSKTTKALQKKMKGMSKTMPLSIKNFRALTESLVKRDREIIGERLDSTSGDKKTQLALDSLLKTVASLTQDDIDGITKILYTASETLPKLSVKVNKGKELLIRADKGLDDINNKIAGFDKGATGTIPKLLYDAGYKDSIIAKVGKTNNKIEDIRLNPEKNLTLKNK